MVASRLHAVLIKGRRPCSPLEYWGFCILCSHLDEGRLTSRLEAYVQAESLRLLISSVAVVRYLHTQAIAHIHPSHGDQGWPLVTPHTGTCHAAMTSAAAARDLLLRRR